MRSFLRASAFLRAGMLVSLCLPTIQCAAQAESSTELEYWRSVLHLNVADGYESYLKRYPSGSFVELARAAQAKLRATAGTDGEEPSQDGVAPSKLAALRATPQTSGAVDFPVGAKFYGPGALLVGYWGAKRHLLLPRGEWVAVGSEVHDLVGTVTIPLTSLAFVKIRDRKVSELLVVTFNHRTPPPRQQGGSAGLQSMPRWPQVDGCEQPDPKALFQLKDSDMRVKWCGVARQTNPDYWSSDVRQPMRLTIESSLRVLDVEAPSLPLQSEAHVHEPYGAFVSYTHYQNSFLNPVLTAANFTHADYSIPKNLPDSLVSPALQSAHFSYHAAMAFQRQYEAVLLIEGVKPNSALTHAIFGRVP